MLLPPLRSCLVAAPLIAACAEPANEPPADDVAAPVPVDLGAFGAGAFEAFFGAALMIGPGDPGGFGLGSGDAACPAREAGPGEVVTYRGGCTTAEGVGFEGELSIDHATGAWSAASWSYQGALAGNGWVDGEGAFGPVIEAAASLRGTLLGHLGAAGLTGAVLEMDLEASDLHIRGDAHFEELGHRVAVEAHIDGDDGMGEPPQHGSGSVELTWPGHVLRFDLSDRDPSSGCPSAWLDGASKGPLCL